MTATPTAPEVLFLAAGMEDAREHLSCGEASIHREVILHKAYYTLQKYETPLPGSVAGQVPAERHETEDCQWFYRKPQLEMEIFYGLNQGRLKSRLVANYKEVRQLDTYPLSESEESQGRAEVRNEGIILTPETAIHDGLSQEFGRLDPRWYQQELIGLVPSQPTYRPTSHPMIIGTETRYGDSCVKLLLQTTPMNSTTYCIDVDRGYLVRHMETVTRFPNKPSFTSVVFDVPRVSESGGVWMPEFVSTIDYLPRFLGVPPGTHGNTLGVLAVREEDVTISHFSTECDFPETVFNWTWPAGTRVFDALTEKSHVIPQNGAVELGEGK